MMQTSKREMVAMDKRVEIQAERGTGGYAKHAGCRTPHGGSRALYSAASGHWQCGGCSTSYHVSDVLAMQSERAPSA